jgi:hypothetical protein
MIPFDKVADLSRMAEEFFTEFYRSKAQESQGLRRVNAD